MSSESYETIREALQDGADQAAVALIGQRGNVTDRNLTRALTHECLRAAAALAEGLDEVRAVAKLASHLNEPPAMLEAATVLTRLDPSGPSLDQRHHEHQATDLDPDDRDGISERLVRVWVEARAYDRDELRAGIERLLNRCPDEGVRAGYRKHIKTDGDSSGTHELQRNAIYRAIEQEAAARRLRKLTSVLEPHPRAVAKMIDEGYDELARDEFTNVNDREVVSVWELDDIERFYDRYDHERIPAVRPAKISRRQAILKRIVSTLSDIDPQSYRRLIDDHDDLRTLISTSNERQRNHVSTTVRDLARTIIANEDEGAFDRYMPVLLNHSYPSVLNGAFDFNTTEQHETVYELLRVLLRWGKDRGKLTSRRVSQFVVGNQLNCRATDDDDWTADARIIDMAYDFGTDLFRFTSIGTVSAERALTTQVALTILERDDLTEYRQKRLFQSLVSSDNEAKLRVVFEHGHTPQSVETYQRLANSALRNHSADFETIIAHWQRDDCPVRGNDIFARALEDVDQRYGWEDQTAMATVMLLRAGWEPSDEAAVQMIYSDLTNNKYLSPDEQKQLAQALARARILPPIDQFQRLEQQDEQLARALKDALPRRARQSYDALTK